MSMSDNGSENSNKYKRTNLFLLRVWCDDADEHEHEHEEPCRVWHGKVQRTVSGEVRSFETKDDLVEVLEAMLYKNRKDRKDRKERSEHGRQLGETISDRSFSSSGNNRIEANKEDNYVR